MTRTLIIPAAGRGSRLGWAGPKALCPVNGRPMLEWLLERYEPLVDHVVIVVAPAASQVFTRYLSGRRKPHSSIDCVVQNEPTGMLPAILCAREAVARRQPDQVWITWCDQVGIADETMRRLAAEMAADPTSACVFPTVRQTPPYIHFQRDSAGTIAGVLQGREGDPMPPMGESDAGLFAMRRHTYLDHLVTYADTAPQGDGTKERNFLPFLPWLARRTTVRTFELPDAREATGVNTPEDLSAMEAYLRERD